MSLEQFVNSPLGVLCGAFAGFCVVLSVTWIFDFVKRARKKW